MSVITPDVCFVCKERVHSMFNIPSEDEWHWVNAAPHSAMGGNMVPIHNRCEGKAMTADERKSETEIHPQKLEPHFSEWMSRLTGERLHSKADIACVLAVLSIDLQAANEQIKRVREALEQCKSYISDASPDYRRKYGVMGYVAVVEAIDRALKC